VSRGGAHPRGGSRGPDRGAFGDPPWEGLGDLHAGRTRRPESNSGRPFPTSPSRADARSPSSGPWSPTGGWRTEPFRAGRAADLGVGVVLSGRSGPDEWRSWTWAAGGCAPPSSRATPGRLRLDLHRPVPGTRRWRLKGDASGPPGPGVAGRVLSQIGLRGAHAPPLPPRRLPRRGAGPRSPRGHGGPPRPPGGRRRPRAPGLRPRGAGLPDRTIASGPRLLLALSRCLPPPAPFPRVSGAGQGTAELHVHLPELPGLNEVRGRLRRHPPGAPPPPRPLRRRRGTGP
jgi:hypothetical protein